MSESDSSYKGKVKKRDKRPEMARYQPPNSRSSNQTTTNSVKEEEEQPRQQQQQPFQEESKSSSHKIIDKHPETQSTNIDKKHTTSNSKPAQIVLASTNGCNKQAARDGQASAAYNSERKQPTSSGGNKQPQQALSNGCGRSKIEENSGLLNPERKQLNVKPATTNGDGSKATIEADSLKQTATSTGSGVRQSINNDEKDSNKPKMNESNSERKQQQQAPTSRPGTANNRVSSSASSSSSIGGIIKMDKSRMDQLMSSSSSNSHQAADRQKEDQYGAKKTHPNPHQHQKSTSLDENANLSNGGGNLKMLFDPSNPDKPIYVKNKSNLKTNRNLNGFATNR
jgi:hypothetical protein